MTGRPGYFRWFLIFWLFILSAVAFLDRVNISIAGASIASAYHLTNVQLGTVFSALLWGYALFQTLGGRLADRFGPRRVLTMGVIWWGVFTAMTAAVPPSIGHALILFVAIRFLLGTGERWSIPPPISLSLAGFPPRNAVSPTDGYSPAWARVQAFRLRLSPS